MKKTRLKKARESVLAYPFFAILIFILLIAFIVPLRSEQNYEESEYASYSIPEPNIMDLLDGSYQESIDSWFSSTFPGRQACFYLSDRLADLHGVGDNYVSPGMQIFSDMLPDDEKSEINQTAEQTAIPVTKPTAMPTPAPTAEPTPAPTPAPAPTAEPTPAPTPEIVIKETSPEIVDASLYASVIRIGDSVYSVQGYSTAASLEYTELVNGFASVCKESGISMYNIIVPTSIGISVPYDIRKNFGSVNQDELLDYLFSHESSDVACVNIFDTMSAHKEEYIYFRTDYPWTSLGAWYAYSDFCGIAGMTPVSLSDCSRISLGEYRGMLYYSVPRRDKLKTDEMVRFILPPDTSEQNGKTCLVVKDAFGDELSEYLRYNYSEVYTIDYRDYTGSVLEYAESIGADEIILCQGIGVSQSSSTLSMLKKILH